MLLLGQRYKKPIGTLQQTDNMTEGLQPLAWQELLRIGSEVRNAIVPDDSIDFNESIDSIDFIDSIDSINSIVSLILLILLILWIDYMLSNAEKIFQKGDYYRVSVGSKTNYQSMALTS